MSVRGGSVPGRIVLVLAAVLLLSGILPTPALRTGPVSGVINGASAGICATAGEMEVLRLVNQRRANFGLRPLMLSAALTASARYHSADMGRNNYFNHTLYDGTPWSQNIRNHGYTYDTWRGENIAAGNSGAYNTFMQWVNSPTHDANMLSPNFVAIGIGYVATPGSSWTHYWTQTFGGYADAPIRGCDGSNPSQAAGAGAPAAPTATRVATTPPTNTNTSGRPARGGGGSAPVATNPPQATATPAPARPTTAPAQPGQPKPSATRPPRR